MKIAFICTDFLTIPPINGGAIQILIDGIAPYISRNHDLTIYCITDPALPDREAVNGVKYIRFPRKNYTNHVARELSKQQSKNQHFDLIHVFNRPQNIHKYKAAMPKSKFIVSCHNDMFNKNIVSDEMGSIAINSVDKIMSISNYIGQTITARFPFAKGKVKTVYSGIDLSRYKPLWKVQSKRDELRKKVGVNHKKVILFVGRLCKAKGPDILIKAMGQVLKKHHDAVLVMIGSRSFSNRRRDSYVLNLHRLAKSLGNNRVIFTNFIPPREIPSYFLLGDVFVCSSQWEEPLARVHFEAMGAGLPVITTKRGGNAEIIKHNKNGIVIHDYRNPKAFADAISSLLSNPDKALKLAKAGRNFAENNFGFQHVSKRLESLYLSTMRGR